MTDIRTKEAESVTFECQFSGTPTPDIIWYKDEKIIRNSRNIQIRIKDKKTTCKILKATVEDEGTYVCKATSEIGMAVSKGNLYVQELTTDERKHLEIKKAKEKQEKVKLERVKLDKVQKSERRTSSVTIETDRKRETADVQEIHVLESTAQFNEKAEKVTAQAIIPIQDSIEISAIASCKKVDDTSVNLERVEERAKEIAPIHESVTISEIQVESSVKDLKHQKVSLKEVVKKSEEESKDTAEKLVTVDVKKVLDTTHLVTGSLDISEIQKEDKVTIAKNYMKSVTEMKEDDSLKVKKITKEEKVVQFVKQLEEQEKIKQAQEVQQLMTTLKAKEFGPGEQPLKELAQVGWLVRHGVKVNEVTALHRAGHFPALQTPLAQSAMVQLVERQGHGLLISRALAEESADEVQAAESVGFQAFLNMVELQHVTVEEAISHFAPEDFHPRSWELQEAAQIIDQKGVEERVKEMKTVDLHVIEVYQVP